jgi:hypothetical protein
MDYTCDDFLLCRTEESCHNVERKIKEVYMAANTGDKTAETKVADAQAAQQVKVTWDDSSMRSVYANVCNVAGTREEIVLLFGMNQAWHSGQKEVTIQLADRIVMSPFVAKRLAALLNSVVKDYESKYGELKI